MLSRIKFKIEPLVNEILDQLPADIWTSKTTTFLDPAIGGGQFVREIECRLRAAGHSDKNISSRVYGCESGKLNVNYATSSRHKYRLVGNYEVCDFLNKEFNMKFDVIVGNPPYQDGNKKGGQNKIYNQFAKTSFDLLSPSGHIAFITPTSVLKDSKRFSLVDINGLKTVNFNANNYFPNVGVNVCAWVVDKMYNGDVTVVSNDIVTTVTPNAPIYDPGQFDSEFAKIYESLKAVTKTPCNRMFKQNPVDASINGRSKTKTSEHNYPVYKIEDNKEVMVQYNKPKPKLHGKNKFVISITKSFSEDGCIVSSYDFDVNHVFIDVNNKQEVENIKSFLFSEYFVKHTANFKKIDGYGFNNAIKYLPPFDKTKPWTNEEVKEFIESNVK